MIRYRRALAATLIALTLASAAYAVSAAEREPFLWRVTSGRSTVYLFGTIHVARRDMYPMPAEVEAAYRRADVVVGELNLNQINPVALIGEMVRRGTYPEGETLSASLSAPTLELLKKRLADEGMALEDIDNYRPWLVSTTLVLRRAARAGFDANLSMDMHYLQRAAFDGKPVEGLETPEKQFKALASGGAEVQDLVLVEALHQVESFDELMNALVDAWKRGDPEALNKAMDAHALDEPKLEAYRKALLGDRDRTMAETIRGYLDSGKTYFVLVGSMHLAGETAIYELLKGDGVTVEKVRRGEMGGRR